MAFTCRNTSKTTEFCHHHTFLAKKRKFHPQSAFQTHAVKRLDFLLTNSTQKAFFEYLLTNLKNIKSSNIQSENSKIQQSSTMIVSKNAEFCLN